MWGPHLTGNELVDLYNVERPGLQAWARQPKPKGVGQAAFGLASPEASEASNPTGQKGSACHAKVLKWLSEMIDDLALGRPRQAICDREPIEEGVTQLGTRAAG